MREIEGSESSRPESPVSGLFCPEFESTKDAMPRVRTQDRVDPGENTLPILQLGDNTDPLLAREDLRQHRTEIFSSVIRDLPQLIKLLGTCDRTERAGLMDDLARQLQGSNIAVLSTIETDGPVKGSYDSFVLRRAVPGSNGSKYTDLILGVDGSITARRKASLLLPEAALDADQAAREMTASIQLFQVLKALSKGQPKTAEAKIEKAFAEAYKAEGWPGVDRAILLLHEQSDGTLFSVFDRRSILSEWSPPVQKAFPLAVSTLGDQNLSIEMTGPGKFKATAAKSK